MNAKRLGLLVCCLFLVVACSGMPWGPQATPLPTGTRLPPPVVLSTPTADSPSVPAGSLPPSSPSPVASEAPLASPTPAVVPPPQTIVVLIADSLRADHVSAYGYERPTTPRLDAFFAQGARFEHTVSTAPWTCPSVAAMLTGRSPSSLGTTFATISHSYPDDATTLAEALQAGGYYTSGFGTTYCLKGKLGAGQGFDHYDEELSDRPSSDKARAEEVNQRVIAWLQNDWLTRSERQPLFLFVYYFDTHVYYDPLPPYDTLYDADYPGEITPQKFAKGEEVIAGKLSLQPRDIEHLQALYDGQVTYWDAYAGQLLTFLQDNGLLENALVMVTADHGDQFGTHGKWVHGTSLFEEVLRVPLLMRYTGVIPPHTVVAEPAQNYDLMPTILDFAGIAAPAEVQAVSLRRAALSGVGDAGRIVYSEVDALNDTGNALYWVAPRLSMRAASQGEWKYIHYLEAPQEDALYRLQPASLYETDNLIAAEAQPAQQLFQALQQWFGLER